MFGNRAFSQIFGTSMGTRMPPPLVNIFISRFDEKIQFKLDKDILLCKQFIDDILIIFTGTAQQAQELMTYANANNKSIKFTFNAYHDTIDFMDIILQIKRQHHTELQTIQKTNRHLFPTQHEPPDTPKNRDHIHSSTATQKAHFKRKQT
jgi:hypothetical protein